MTNTNYYLRAGQGAYSSGTPVRVVESNGVTALVETRFPYRNTHVAEGVVVTGAERHRFHTPLDNLQQRRQRGRG